jgi:hydroxyacylglutathione hydrolase
MGSFSPFPAATPSCSGAAPAVSGEAVAERPPAAGPLGDLGRCPPGAEARQVSLIPVLRDNYVFVLHGPSPGPAVLVDPAVAEPVIAWLQERDLEPVAILHTHHHSDHIGGTPELLRRWPQAAVIASAADRERIPLQTCGVAGGDRFTLLGRPVEVLSVPGHTRHHIAYYLPPAGQARVAGAEAPSGDPLASPPPTIHPVPATSAEAGDLFCGDTLFAAGCGRLFEGTPEQMHASLQCFAALPDATRVWCAHEYTATNLEWARTLEPQDPAIGARLAAVRAARAAGQPTIPSRIALERATNLFLRAPDPAALAALRSNRNDWTG